MSISTNTPPNGSTELTHIQINEFVTIHSIQLNVSLYNPGENVAIATFQNTFARSGKSILYSLLIWSFQL